MVLLKWLLISYSYAIHINTGQSLPSGTDLVPILEPIDHQNSILEHHLSQVEIDALHQHGCWCKELGYSYDVTGGAPVDELDHTEIFRLN